MSFHFNFFLAGRGILFWGLSVSWLCLTGSGAWCNLTYTLCQKRRALEIVVVKVLGSIMFVSKTLGRKGLCGCLID